ncbi:MAG: 30S ribosomal protein S6 [Candidatus Latescibacteria bacterium]|nr:30S ribosomal protein S6 [Candidatus Latescibacterota bacterium]NIM21120.1 30S ribosomal protein S6 [Candidatus Latescibacterota bacterium]NIM65255.1 30S ribosomal protein S6 [Candidatus Latescibacterota bacterium]NIO01770.1 30S ribosomal protein S6 [Candidatus Latescibacterota bacterium]NIO28287.1 30S ribosomal protein S6 [Candidatus Latescibacterota bacterium]
MRNYECTIIVSPAVGDDELKNVAKKYAKVIASGGGELTKLENWGKRRLAYEIDHNDEAHYLFYKLRCENSVLHELNRMLRLDEMILRHMVVKDSIATGEEPKIDSETALSAEEVEKEEG